MSANVVRQMCCDCFGGNAMETNWPINLTLVVEVLIFAVLVWFTMHVIWPPLINVLEARQRKIAEGLAATELGQKNLEEARAAAQNEIKQAKTLASSIIEHANVCAAQLVSDAKHKARTAAQQRTNVAFEHLAQAIPLAEQALRTEVADLAKSCAEKILIRS